MVNVECFFFLLLLNEIEIGEKIVDLVGWIRKRAESLSVEGLFCAGDGFVRGCT